MNIDLSKIMTDFYEAVTFEIVIKFVILYFFIIWIAILLWVMKDIKNRTNNIFFQVICIFTILFLTPLWVFIYLLIRPWKTLFEKYYEEIEENLELFSQIIEEKNNKCETEFKCFSCTEPISPDFKFCPNCKVSLKNECETCKKLLYSDWKVCPYCWDKQKGKSEKKNKKEK